MRSTKLRFYLHDLAEFCQIQLLGVLTEAELPELDGCCKTVQPTLTNRKLVIDASRLESADTAGEEWLRMMKGTGAEVIRTPVDAAEGLGIREGAAYLLRQALRANRGAQ